MFNCPKMKCLRYNIRRSNVRRCNVHETVFCWVVKYMYSKTCFIYVLRHCYIKYVLPLSSRIKTENVLMSPWPLIIHLPALDNLHLKLFIPQGYKRWGTTCRYERGALAISQGTVLKESSTSKWLSKVKLLLKLTS